MPEVLHRKSEALTFEEFNDYLRRRLGGHLLATSDEYATHTLLLDAEGYVEAATLCRDDRRLAFDLFDCLFGIDAREDGFHVVAVLYSTATGRRILLKHLCQGGRETPVAPSLTALYHGADWHEREAWDMFGIEFEGHPGLAPRILCAENFEGWPLRKDFYLATREAKPWPGVKEPAELDDEGNVIERVPGPGGAPGPTALDEAMAKQAKLANPQEEEIAEEEAAAGDVATPTAEGAEAPVVAGTEERVAEDVEEVASDAKVKAEQTRKAAAEARARKAAERAEHGAEPDEPVTTPVSDVAAVPQDEARDPGQAGTGGPPATPSQEGAGSHTEESPIEGGMHEHIDEAREKGTTDPAAAGEPPVVPEGRRLTDEQDTDDDADEEDDA